jgi:hypothetical protein
MAESSISLAAAHAVCIPVCSALSSSTRPVPAAAAAGDDTALNSVEVKCKTPSGSLTNTINPNTGLWGTWSAVSSCPAGSFVNGVQLRVLSDQGSKDDVAADAVRLLCSDNITTLQTPNAVGFGTWGTSVRCVKQTF